MKRMIWEMDSAAARSCATASTGIDMYTYADVCGRMLTYADVSRSEVLRDGKHRYDIYINIYIYLYIYMTYADVC